MNSKVAWLSLCAFCCTASGATHYVDLNCPTPTAPYTNWAAAATSIQDALDAASMNDTVLVTNGIYASGGRLMGGMTNRVVLGKQITLQSVNGPHGTVIRGYQVPGVTNGDAAVRCVYFAGGGVLSGFTVTGGATLSSSNGFGYQGSGGGVFDSLGGLVTNCVIVGNAAYYRGGGTYAASVTKSTLCQNSAPYGGGAYGGGVDTSRISGNSAIEGGGANNAYLLFCEVTGNTAFSSGGVSIGQYGGVRFCTITGNSARSAGGVSNGSVDNSIVYFNKACGDDRDQTGASWDHSCTPLLPTYLPPSPTGAGNMSSDPQLASTSHLSAGSPCRGAGSHPFGAAFPDIDGDPWASPPSIGCDEYIIGSVTGALSVAIGSVYTNAAAGFQLEVTALIEGRTSASVWDFGDGVTISNRPYASHAWATPGNYVIVLTAYNETHPEGVNASLNILVQPTPVHYVDVGSTNPVAPYSTWETAATDIQSAVDAAGLPGELVLVNEGVFDSGGRAVYGTMTNRVVIDKPVRVQSLSGPANTFIVGAQAPAGGCGDGAIRCVYLADGAILSGFTLTNGATRTSGAAEYENYGGAVWCASLNGVITNCVLTGNSAIGGGAAYGGFLVDSLVTSNYAAGDGGGVKLVSLVNCIISGNSAKGRGGATCSSLVRNCTVFGNFTRGWAGAVDLSTSENCIIYFNNTNSVGYPQDWSLGTLKYCCTTSPYVALLGSGNFTNDPLFVDWKSWNLHLQSNSPCINAGKNGYVSTPTDLDGNPRIAGGTVDVGAYEFQTPLSHLSYAWLQSYGLPTDGSADSIDSDGDGLNNWQEHLAGTDPTNAASALRVLSVSPGAGGVTVTWQTVTNRNYFLERATDPVTQNSFSRVASNLSGGPGTTTFTDTNTPQAGPLFYRVGAILPQP